jgi:DNA-binding NarL/FixJ family response regulator
MLKDRGHSFYPIFISASKIGSVIDRALMAGGCGFLVKPIEDKTLIFSIYDVVHGGFPMSKKTMQVFIEYLRSKKISEPPKCSIEDSRSLLTSMEDVVFALLIEGSSSKEIANIVSVSLATVNSPIHHIFKKFKVASRSKLMALILKKMRPMPKQ